jgi:transposase
MYMSRPFGTPAELERRRIEAVRAIKSGESPEVVARVLRVNRSSVYRWLKSAEETDGLAAKPHPGPALRLSPEQHEQLEALLLEGAKAHGWPTELWTCARVVEMVRRRFGVSFHHDHVGRFLRDRLGWTPQKRAAELGSATRRLSTIGSASSFHASRRRHANVMRTLFFSTNPASC